MVAVPPDTPVTMPFIGFTVATGKLLLLQVPPPRPLLLRVVVRPEQTVVVPLMVPALGVWFTVTKRVVLLLQPLALTI